MIVKCNQRVPQISSQVSFGGNVLTVPLMFSVHERSPFHLLPTVSSPEPLRSCQVSSLTTAPLTCHILWTWMLLHLPRVLVSGMGVDRLGTRARLSPDPREASVFHVKNSTTFLYAYLCLPSLWEPLLERGG